ncbi:MAG: cyanophycinase [Planctomycetaceae bacterium]|nr:cyanophycinase [Planctomycetaceae bacterium]
MPHALVRFAVVLLIVTAVVANVHGDEAQKTTIGPEKGSLVIVGGGRMVKPIVDEFISRAGGSDAAFVVIPTANVGEDWGEKYVAANFLTKRGAKDVVVLHTRDPKVADTEEFVAPLRRAKAVWIDGGRQWRLADSYLGTRTLKELEAVLDRGGVIGGSSAGATIQGSYLVRGAPEGNTIMMAKGHEVGFGFLKCCAIDQHVIARKRENDLAPVIEAHPELLGLGIDEATAVVVTGNRFKVVGDSKVVVHDAGYKPESGPKYYLLKAGDEFDLTTRKRLD